MKNQDQVTAVGEINNVPFSEFNTATSEWKGARMAHNGMFGSIILPTHFDVPLEDLRELLREAEHLQDTDCVRAFIGVINYGEYNGQSNTSEMRLYLTGVDEDGQPIFHAPEGKSAIYDFTMPCPPTC